MKTKVTRIDSFGARYKSFIATLKALGCIYCPLCVAYVYPDHQHVLADRKVA